VHLIAARLPPAIALVLLVGSTFLGLAFLLATGFGYLPALGGHELTFEPLEILFADRRVISSGLVTILAGALGTMAAVAMAFALAASLDPEGTAPGGWTQRLALGVLGVPHAALAVGLFFLVAPSGWLMRVLQAAIGAWPLPPDWQLVPSESGLLLALALFLKETPFLFFAMITGLRQLQPERHLIAARTLGYDDTMAWLKLVLPRLYPLVRFPILAVLAYSLSVVDMSLILGPTTPSTLPVLILKWSSDPDLGQRFVAAAAGLMQLALVIGAILAWCLGERVTVRLTRAWLSAGDRHVPACCVLIGRWVRRLVAGLGVALVAFGVSGLILWSVAHDWRYPALLPETVNWVTWRRSFATLAAPVFDSVAFALSATLLALVLSVACLQHERVLRADIVRSAERWLFLPLLVPEICFLFGLQILLLLAGLNGTWLAVLWMHVLFVFPYVFLTLKEPWRAFDLRYESVGFALGQSGWRVLWHIRLPMLRAPISWAAAVGCTVSLSLYLPTLQGGEGRIETLATEAVALSAGGDRRIVAVFGLVQTLAAGMFFMSALLCARGRRWRQA
jgi:putative thiamine transport system permease protein